MSHFQKQQKQEVSLSPADIESAIQSVGDWRESMAANRDNLPGSKKSGHFVSRLSYHGHFVSCFQSAYFNTPPGSGGDYNGLVRNSALISEQRP